MFKGTDRFPGYSNGLVSKLLEKEIYLKKKKMEQNVHKIDALYEKKDKIFQQRTNFVL